MGEPSSARPSLHLGSIFRGAVSLPRLHRVRLWRGIGTPFLLIISGAAIVAFSSFSGGRWVRFALGTVIFCCVAAMAVVIHRLVLLPAEESHANASGLGLQRLVKASLAMLCLWAVFTAAGLAMAYTIRGAVNAFDLSIPPLWLQTLGAAVAVWVVARLCLVTPGLVLDRPNAWRTALSSSRGNGWRLVGVLAAAPWLFMLCMQTLWPGGVPRLEFVLIIAISTLLAIFQLFAISLCYRKLTAPAPPPSDPPG